MTTESAIKEEPRLTVMPRPPIFFLRRRFLWLFTPPALIALIGAISLTFFLPGNLSLPLSRIVMMEGKLGSKADFFEDEEAKRILLKHHIQVHVTRSSSREIATYDIDKYDFVFPSGQPTAELIASQRDEKNLHVKRYRPFVSPIVLASYREYAETLREAGVATSQSRSDPGNSLYYHLDMKKFLALVRDGRRWDDLDIGRHGTRNGNKIVAQTSGVCSSNSAATYLGLVAFVENGNDVVQALPEAEALAKRIKPLLTGQGLSSQETFKNYTAPEGAGIAPIVVVYEHQYLAYQLDRQTRSGKPDSQRVLLYPTTHFITQPEFLSLNAKGDRLGELISNDPQLRRRAVELGFRVLDPSAGAPPGQQLSSLLQQRGIPSPTIGPDSTKSVLPRVDLLEKMITLVGECDPVEPS